MFPLNQEGDDDDDDNINSFVQIPFTPNLQEQNVIGQQGFVNFQYQEQLVEDNVANQLGISSQQPQILTTPGNHGEANNIRINDRRIIRRDVERQRRLQMSFSFASLRALLPVDCTQGKRSVSDQIDGAISYIKQLKENTLQYEMERDKLKGFMNSSSSQLPGGTGSSNSNIVMNNVRVSELPGGVEIVISSRSKESMVPLSEVLKILLQQGCDVVSCHSAEVDDRVIHSIKSEVDRLTRHGLSFLQQKLQDCFNRFQLMSPN